MAQVLVCGGFAGVATWVSVYPLDVVKSRVQTDAEWVVGRVGDIEVRA